jgi:hypothetical protein
MSMAFKGGSRCRLGPGSLCDAAAFTDVGAQKYQPGRSASGDKSYAAPPHKKG